MATIEKCPWCGNPITHAKFLQIQDAIRKDEQRKLETAERAIRERLEKEIAAQQKKIEALRRKESAEVRAILQKDRESAILKKEAEFARERDALQKKIADMSRRVRKSGGEAAEGAEIDLLDELRGAFPDDQLTRTKG